MINQFCKVYNGWYQDAQIYDNFSIAEDKENKGLNPILKALPSDFIAQNPIDLASGTGRVVDWILQNIPYRGMIYAVENQKAMCKFLDKKYDWRVVIINTEIKELKNHPLRNNIKSNFIVSRFGFPSRVWDKKLAWEELCSVYAMLSDDGYFITSGWDEKFNDDLNKMWFLYCPDGLWADTFEEWQRERQAMITSPRNAHLTILQDNIETELAFDSLSQSANVIGSLFGEEALKSIVRQNKINWDMRMSITFNTKQDLEIILKKYEKRIRGVS